MDVQIVIDEHQFPEDPFVQLHRACFANVFPVLVLGLVRDFIAALVWL